MTYAAYAEQVFRSICDAAPANGCSVEKQDNTTILDIGYDKEGGWSSAKQTLDALIGGRGIVTISRDFRGIHQFPALEVLYDDPVGVTKESYSLQNRTLGIKKPGQDSAYAFGLRLLSDNDDVTQTGNIAILRETSLAFATVEASRALPDAITLLLDSGIDPDDICWAWSFAPLAVLSNQTSVMEDAIRTANERRTVSIWLRGDDAKLLKIVEEYDPGTLRLHNLTTAKTLMVEGPASALNC